MQAGFLPTVQVGSIDVVAKYTYDTWGAPRTITDGSNNDVSSNSSHIANINPIRYRGYYYDIDTGLYYVQSRYYDPVVGRFVNADGQLNDGLLGYNLFAYCLNNPVRFFDDSGCRCVENGPNSSWVMVTNRGRVVAGYASTARERIVQEFSEIYYRSYKKKFFITNSATIIKTKEEITKAEVILESLVFTATLTLALKAVGLYMGGETNILTAAEIFLGCAGSMIMPAAAHYDVYTVTYSGVNMYPVEAHNYHGYRVYADRAFKWQKTVKYYVLNGYISHTQTSFTDEYLAYRYRNHP